MRRYLIFLFVFLLIGGLLFSFGEIFEPSPFGIGTGYTLSMFQLSPTIGIYMPGGSFPPSASYSKVSYTEENGNFRNYLYNKNSIVSDSNYFKGVSASSLVAAYGNFSIFRISLDNLFSKYDSEKDSFFLSGFKGQIYGATYYKKSGNFQYGLSFKRYSGKFYSGYTDISEYYRSFGDQYNYILEKMEDFEPLKDENGSDNVSFYTLESSISFAVYRFLYLSLKISPINKVKISAMDKTISPTYKGGITFIASRATSFNFSILLKSENDFYSDTLKQPISLSMIHFFSNISFITLSWKSDVKSGHLFAAGYQSVLSGGIGYVFGNTVYTFVSASLSSWNKLSSFNFSIAYISHNFK